MHGKGFTLLEILITVVLIGVMAGVAMPLFVGASESAYENKASADVATLNTQAESFLSNESSTDVAAFKAYTSWSDAADYLVTKGYLRQKPEQADGYTYSFSGGYFSAAAN